MKTLDHLLKSQYLTDSNSRLVPFVDVTSITIGTDEKFLKTGDDPLLTIGSAGHALHVFVNGQLAGKKLR